MLRIRELPYDEIRELLASEELRAVNEALCQRSKMRMAPESNPTVTLQSAMNEVCYTGLSTAEFRALLSRDKSLILQFSAECAKGEDLGEEYPPGEEPDPDEEMDVEEELGLSPTAGIHLATLLHFLRDRTHADLMTYLEMSRTPHRKKYAKQLRRAYDDAAAAVASGSH